MATHVIRKIGATTGDSSTVAAGITWGQDSANYDRSSDNILDLVIVDDEDFNESNLGLTGFTGTATAAKYVRLRADTGDIAADRRCKGKFQQARISGSTNTEHVFNGCEDFAHIKNIAIKQASTNASDECWRLSSGCNDALFEKCYLETNNISSQDGIYAGAFIVTNITIFDCVIKMGGSNARVGIHSQKYSGASNTHSWHCEHNTIDGNGSEACIGGERAGSGLVTVNGWNNACFDAVTDFDRNTGTKNDIDFPNDGDGNLSGDTSAQTEFTANTANVNDVALTVTDTGSADSYLITTLGSDYQLLDGVNVTDSAIGNAVDGSTRDSRIDLTVDIAGNARPGPYADRDSGAFEIAAAGSGGVGVPLSLLHRPQIRHMLNR